MTKKTIRLLSIGTCVLVLFCVLGVVGLACEDKQKDIPIETTETIVETEATIETTEETTEPTVETEAVETTEVTEPIETEPAETEAIEEKKCTNEEISVDVTGGYTQPYGNNTWDTYVGQFSIPDVGLHVKCYASSSQATVDATNSAAYFNGWNHLVICDHYNQGFERIKNCTMGTIAYVPIGGQTVKYEVIDKMYGHNSGYGLFTSDWRIISDVYPGTVCLYTCDNGWQNIVMVFLKPVGSSLEDISGSFSNGYSEYWSSENCRQGKHDWISNGAYVTTEMTPEGKAVWYTAVYICNYCDEEMEETTYQGIEAIAEPETPVEDDKDEIEIPYPDEDVLGNPNPDNPDFDDSLWETPENTEPAPTEPSTPEQTGPAEPEETFPEPTPSEPVGDARPDESGDTTTDSAIDNSSDTEPPEPSDGEFE